MSFSVGIGVVTYNRRDILRDTIDRVRGFTGQPDAALVIADDGSSDGTLAMLREKLVPVITGVNMGIAWNKNRALFLLGQMLKCETVILLEDDTRPNRSGWELRWIDAAKRWGHVNLAGDWMQEHFLSGSGSAEDPVHSKFVTAQCAAYSWTALTFGGYFDPRFTGYGHEHVDHSRRLIRAGFGGTARKIDGQDQVLFNLIKGDLTTVECKSHLDITQSERNLALATQITGEEHYRAPWANDSQMRQFRSEVESAMCDGKERFRMTPALPRAAAPKRFKSLFAWA